MTSTTRKPETCELVQPQAGERNTWVKLNAETDTGTSVHEFILVASVVTRTVALQPLFLAWKFQSCMTLRGFSNVERFS